MYCLYKMHVLPVLQFSGDHTSCTACTISCPYCLYCLSQVRLREAMKDLVLAVWGGGLQGGPSAAGEVGGLGGGGVGLGGG